MMNNPKTCRESIKLGGTFICKLECTLCGLHFGKECAKEKMDKFLNAMGIIVGGTEDDAN